MSCKKPIRDENCIIKIVKDIVIAQNDVSREPKCKTGCAQSISDLLNQGDCSSYDKTRPDTIPVILYCNSTCEPFVGKGASEKSDYFIEESEIFRINEVSNDNCAVIELLKCERDGNEEGRVDNLEKTGICMTVDLTCFCHISCLPAVKLR